MLITTASTAASGFSSTATAEELFSWATMGFFIKKKIINKNKREEKMKEKNEEKINVKRHSKLQNPL